MLDILKKLDRWERDIDRLFPEVEPSKRDRLAAAAQVERKPWPEFARGTMVRSGNEMIDFEPYPYQIRINELIDQHRGTVIVKTRQMGITEAIASRMLQEATESPAYAGAVFSKGDFDTSNIANRVALMAATSDIALPINNTERKTTEHGAQLFFRPSTDDAGRGFESISKLVFDEAAFPRNIKNIYGAASPSQKMLGNKARTVFISTPSPDGPSGFFWELLERNNPDGTDILKICEAVKEGELYSDEIPGFFWFTDQKGWCKIVLHWKAHPIYALDPNYLETVRENDRLDEATLQREFNLSFADSSAQVFDTAFIDAAFCSRPMPAYPGRRYLLAIDTSQGGDDFYTESVLDITDPIVKEVFKWRSHKRTSDYYMQHTFETFDTYKPVVTVFETNASGQLYFDQMVLNRPSAHVEGVYTGPKSKPVNVGRLVLLLERQQLHLIPDDETRNQFRNFRRLENGKMEGQNGWHDDEVMKLAIASTQIDINRRSTQLQPRVRKANLPSASDIFG